MASARLFGNKIPPACKYCENARGKITKDGMTLCAKKGVVPADYACRLYIYDPIKRIPKKLARQDFDPTDFEL
ncbi:MAG: hypothetical protein LBV27_10205 [Oscillospiraceae bacterium]|jgi:hypothetical protein|nr:hypothetical protein [Oscillospiraceae bacterium]